MQRISPFSDVIFVHLLLENGNVERFQLLEVLRFHVGGLAVGADDDLLGPRRERERHSDRFSS